MNKYKELCDMLVLKISNGDISVTKSNDVGYILDYNHTKIRLDRSYILTTPTVNEYVSGYALHCDDYIDFSADDNTENGKLLRDIYNACESVILNKSDIRLEKLMSLLT